MLVVPCVWDYSSTHKFVVLFYFFSKATLLEWFGRNHPKTTVSCILLGVFVTLYGSISNCAAFEEVHKCRVLLYNTEYKYDTYIRATDASLASQTLSSTVLVDISLLQRSSTCRAP